MGKRTDESKRWRWSQRLERYRSSDVTIARFCAQERVSVATFHYWARQLRPTTSPSECAAGSHQAVSPPVILFDFGRGARVAIPAHCLEALRCMVAGLREPGGEVSTGAFQRVVTRSR